MMILLIVLMTILMLGCALNFLYRFTYEGAESMKRPQQYHSVRRTLNWWAALGLLSGIAILWWRVDWITAVAWFVIYNILEIVVSNHGKRRFLKQITELLRTMHPEMSEKQLLTEANARLAFEKKANEGSGEHL